MSYWTAEKMAQLRDLHGKGFSHAQICHKMRLSKGSVSGKISRLGGLKNRESPIKAAASVTRKPARVRAPRADGSAFNRSAQCSTFVSGITREQVSAAVERRERVTDCCWPVAEDKRFSRQFRFCGDASAPGKPYCETHCRVAYVRPHPQSCANSGDDTEARP